MSSDSEDENVIRYGTPLEPYEEDDIPSKKKFQQPTDQYAVDEHGRRRFHGAFTGGFSAGFQNTVGTAEGWTPATFKSSRAEKAQRASQRPEDFMDDEDRSEFGIAPRNLQTHSEFSGRKRPRPQQFHDGPIPGEPVLEQLVRAVHETAAVKMLRAMGWKPGQGTGERVSKREKRKAALQHKVYGCYMPPEMRQDKEVQSEESSDSEFEYETLFAPDDYDPYVLAHKNDRFGLGYSGLSRHSVLGNLPAASTSHLQMRDKGKKVSIRGQAFGVGAFEADDEDIYATEDMSHYDFALGGPSQEKKKEPVRRENNVLEGFVKSTKPFPSVPSYPPPALPRDYTPLPAGMRRTRFDPTDAPQRDQAYFKNIFSHDENTETMYTIRNISTDEQQIVISFKSNSSCNEDQNLANYKRIVGDILRGLDVIVVTKQDQLKDLISDAVDASDQSYVASNATVIVSFTPHPESSVEHHATWLKEMPIGVAEDLATSTEFVYGNLWFLIPREMGTSCCKEDVMNDVRKLTPSAFSEAPVLHHEAVASPAMYDGLEILWFNANQNILSERFAF